MTVIIVGNGPISEGYSAFIDSFETVIRINDFRLGEFTHLAGEKTTIHAFLTPKPCKVEGAEIWDFRPNATVPTEFKRKCFQMVDTLPSCGFFAIHYALEQFGPPVNIIGFDFFASRDSHCKGKYQGKISHNGEGEKRIISNLEEQGTIIWHNKKENHGKNHI